MKPASIHLLVVDDDPADLLLAELALAEQPEPYLLSTALGGTAALERFEGPPGSWPDLVLMDLHMPGLSGLDVLKRLKAEAERRAVPVVIISTSRNEADVRRAYAGHASAYLLKPDDQLVFAAELEALLRFWREAALPTRRAGNRPATPG